MADSASAVTVEGCPWRVRERERDGKRMTRAHCGVKIELRYFLRFSPRLVFVSPAADAATACTQELGPKNRRKKRIN